jgi:nucleotide-binding universal stress UspA family protein
MFKNILVPLDGSPMADRILPHVAGIARISRAPVTLLRVLETDGLLSTAVDPLAWHLAKAEAQAHLNEAAEQLTHWGLTSNPVLLEGSAAQRVVEYAHKHGADLLILSSHGQGGLSGWNVSGIAQKVIHHAGTSIMFVRSSDKSAAKRHGVEAKVVQYRQILVPLDGSQRAECSLPLASILADLDAADLLVVHVIARPEMIQRVPLSSEDAALAQRVVARNTAEVDKYFAQLQSRLSPTLQTRVLVDDNIARALHDLVEQEQVDLVVLSAHGHSCHSEWPYGDLVNNFINYGATSLLILQDLPFSEKSSDRAAHTAQGFTLPAGRTNREERLYNHAHFAV